MHKPRKRFVPLRRSLVPLNNRTSRRALRKLKRVIQSPAPLSDIPIDCGGRKAATTASAMPVARQNRRRSQRTSQTPASAGARNWGLAHSPACNTQDSSSPMAGARRGAAARVPQVPAPGNFFGEFGCAHGRPEIPKKNSRMPQARPRKTAKKTAGARARVFGDAFNLWVKNSEPRPIKAAAAVSLDNVNSGSRLRVPQKKNGSRCFARQC